MCQSLVQINEEQIYENEVNPQAFGTKPKPVKQPRPRKPDTGITAGPTVSVTLYMSRTHTRRKSARKLAPV